MAEFSAMEPLQSEDEAWERLAAIIDGTAGPISDANQAGRIADEWAHLSLTFEGLKFHGTITPPIMEALLTLQTAINRSLALTARGIENARLLTDAEKNKVEIQASVKDGSTTIDVNGTEIINHLIDVAGASMTGEQMTIIAIVAALLFFGHSAYRVYLSSKATIRSKEIDSREKIALIEQIATLSEQETARAKILTDALSREPKLLVIKGESDKVYDSILKSAADADVTRIQGVSIAREVANDLISVSRSAAKISTISGIYRVLYADANLAEGFRFKLRNVESGETLVTGLRDALVFEKQGETIRRALFARRLVRITLETKIIRGTIRDATVVAAEMLETPADTDEEDDTESGEANTRRGG